jgi:hypothetical protein
MTDNKDNDMLLHTFFGHSGCWLFHYLNRSDIGLSIHYHTLPKRVKNVYSKEQIPFSFNKELLFIDLFWLPVASFISALGLKKLASIFFCLGPWETARFYDTCGYYPFTSGGVKRKTHKMTASDIVWYLMYANLDLPEFITNVLDFDNNDKSAWDLIRDIEKEGEEFRAKIQNWLESRKR